MTRLVATKAGFAATAVAVLLAACTDPGTSACETANRDITLGNLMQNSATGAYDRCLTDLRSELSGLQLQARTLDAEAVRLNTQAAGLDGERRAAAQRLASLNTAQADIMRQIATAGPASGASDTQVQTLVNREAQLRSAIAAQNSTGGVDSSTANELLLQQQQLNLLAQQIM
jgi:chromosome segregation ATPase